MKRDYYEVLGVPRTATDEEIKKAFRKASLEHHPDRQIGKSDEEKKASEAQFKEIAEAYSILGNKEKRKEYDQFGFAGPNFQNGGPDMGDFRSSDFFRGKGPWADFLRNHGFDFGFGDRDPRHGFSMGGEDDAYNVRKTPEEIFKHDGRDIGVRIGVSIKEQIFGGKKEFDLSIPKKCPSCNGMLGEGFEICPICGGSGRVVYTPSRFIRQVVTCNSCNGTGYKVKNPCGTCNGLGRMVVNEHLVIDLHPGLLEGVTIETKEGLGEAGIYGGKDGNLILTSTIEGDGTFKLRRGTPVDLDEDLFISPLVGLVGGKLKIPTPDGVNEVDVVPGLGEGDILTITNAGLRYGIHDDRRGKLFVTLHYGTLDKLSEADRKAIKKISDKMAPEAVKEFDHQLRKYKAEYQV